MTKYFPQCIIIGQPAGQRKEKVSGKWSVLLRKPDTGGTISSKTEQDRISDEQGTDVGAGGGEIGERVSTSDPGNLLEELT